MVTLEKCKFRRQSSTIFERLTGLSLVTKAKHRFPAKRKNDSDVIFGDKWDLVNEQISLTTQGSFTITATRGEWLTWLPEYYGSLPTEISIKHRWLTTTDEKKTYAKAHLRSLTLQELDRRYFLGARREKSPFTSCLEIFQAYNIVGYGCDEDNFAFRAGLTNLKSAIATPVVSAYPGFSEHIRNFIHTSTGVDAYSENIANRAKRGILPNIPIIKMIVCNSSDKDSRHLSEQLSDLGISYEKKAISLLVGVVDQWRKKRCYTDETETGYHCPYLFPNDLGGIHNSVPIAFDLSATCRKIVEESMSEDDLISIFKRSQFGPFDLAPDEQVDKPLYTAAILSSKKYKCLREHYGGDVAISQLDKQCNATPKAYQEYRSAAAYNSQVEHFIPRVLLRQHGVPQNDAVWCRFMTERNHMGKFNGLIDVAGVVRKRDICIEQGWWTDDQAHGEICSMIRKVREHESALSIKKESSLSIKLLRAFMLDETDIKVRNKGKV